MGFSGSFVVARADRPLNELASVRAAGGQFDWLARDGAWQILQLTDGGECEEALVAETGGPVLAMHVLDSDFAFVDGRSPGGRSWNGVLSPRMARAYQIPEQFIGEPGEVAREAMAWAEEAGLRPDPVAVRAALVAECDPLAEELVFALAEALGFTFGPGEYLRM